VREDAATTLYEARSKQVALPGFKEFAPQANVAPASISTDALENALRRYGVEGEDAFLALACRYLDVRRPATSRLKYFALERAEAVLGMVAHDKQVMSVLDSVVGADPLGRELPTWYQFFFGRRFREGSGKFFTPRNIAAAMARLLPVVPHGVIADLTCGGGTFLAEASRHWQDEPCRLFGNDVDRMLVGLTEIVLALSAPPHHPFGLSCCNIYDGGPELAELKGKVSAILANPPFSLPLEHIGIDSGLFTMGYRNSDAVFLDVCLDLMAPGGDLVCLLPHSLVANSEFHELRKTVERNWELCGVVTLPEGVFYLTGNTTTRADIVHLRKHGGRHVHRHRAFFANAPTVGFPLNSRTPFFGENSLDTIVGDNRVQECVLDGEES